MTLATQNQCVMGKNVVFRMCLNLNDFQSKTDRYKDRLEYISSMVTINQNTQQIHENFRERN